MEEDFLDGHARTVQQAVDPLAGGNLTDIPVTAVALQGGAQAIDEIEHGADAPRACRQYGCNREKIVFERVETLIRRMSTTGLKPLDVEGQCSQVGIDSLANAVAAGQARRIELGFERTPDIVLVPDERLRVSWRQSGRRTRGHEQAPENAKNHDTNEQLFHVASLYQ